MKLTNQEQTEIKHHLHGLLHTKETALMKRCIQHSAISTYDHVLSVVRLSFYLNRRLHLGAPSKELVRGAFLHDFYLYFILIKAILVRLHKLNNGGIVQ